MRAGHERQCFVEIAAQLSAVRALPGYWPVTARPPPISWPDSSNPPTSSPCQQCSEMATSRETLESRVDIDAPMRVLLPCQRESPFVARSRGGHGFAFDLGAKESVMIDPSQFCLNEPTAARESPVCGTCVGVASTNRDDREPNARMDVLDVANG